MSIQSTTFSNLSEYRKHIVDSLRYSYSQYGHIFASNPLQGQEETRRRNKLDDYMRHLLMMPFGAVLLQLEVQGQKAIDEAFADGRIYEMGGIWATKVQTETFSYYTTDPDAEGAEEWLPFLLDETYIDRQGNPKQKFNQKALNLAFKKPLEGEIITEVDERFQRWFKPVLDMFRRHYEARETVEGQMILNLYFEYVSNNRKVLQKYPGEDKLEVRVQKIETLMDQLLLDIEEVRLTAKDRSYTSEEIIEAARRAIHNFCVDQNRQIIGLLGSKKTVSMFLEGMSSPTVVYHTNSNPSDWRSPMLPTTQLVTVAERCFLRLAMNDQQRSKIRMDEKAFTTYAPVAHAETRRAHLAVQNVSTEDWQDLETDQPALTELPFGLNFGSSDTDKSESDLDGFTITDVMVGQGAVTVPYVQVDLKTVPYAAIGIEGDQLNLVHRWATLQEAAQSLRETEAKLNGDPDRVKALRSRVKLLHDPTGSLGAEGSTRLLRTLSEAHKAQITHQNDRYWSEWVVIKQIRGGEQQQELLKVVQRFTSPSDAALLMQETLQLHKQQLTPEAFKGEARCLKLVHDPEGHLPASGATKPAEGIPQILLNQMAALHYEVSRGKVTIRVPYLDAGLAELVNTTLAQAAIARFRQAKAVVGSVPTTSDSNKLEAAGFQVGIAPA